MGVEYVHTLVVKDPDWLPQPDTAARIDAVLRHWLLVSVDPEVYDLSKTREYEMKRDDERRRLYARPVPVAAPGQGLVLLYPEVMGPMVERVFGPSYYPSVDPNEAYIYTISVIVGDDIRIHSGQMDINYPQIVQPPTKNGAVIEPYSYNVPLAIYGDAYPADAATTPPIIEMMIEPALEKHIGWQDYAGYFRGALVLDCNKNLPKFIEGKHVLPSHDFVNAVSEAFRSPLLEFGHLE